MANTTYLTTVVEQHVRERLGDELQLTFEKVVLPLPPGGTHEFDAVSTDRTIVASIKSASGRTAGGKNPSGKIKDCIAELYFLEMVDADRRILVLTSPEFYELFVRTMRGKIAPAIEVRHLPLSPEIQAEVARVQKSASDEVFPVLDAAESAVVEGGA